MNIQLKALLYKMKIRVQKVVTTARSGDKIKIQLQRAVVVVALRISALVTIRNSPRMGYL